MDGAGSTYGERITFSILVGKPLGKRPLADLRSWEDNINIDPKQVGQEDMYQIEVAQDMDTLRILTKAVTNLP